MLYRARVQVSNAHFQHPVLSTGPKPKEPSLPPTFWLVFLSRKEDPGDPAQCVSDVSGVSVSRRQVLATPSVPGVPPVPGAGGGVMVPPPPPPQAGGAGRGSRKTHRGHGDGVRVAKGREMKSSVCGCR